MSAQKKTNKWQPRNLINLATLYLRVVLGNCMNRFYVGNPSITNGVHRNENFVEIIPVFSNFFKTKKKKYLKAILCNFSMPVTKIFFKEF